MIEGLRLLPWIQEAARRGTLGLKPTCGECMQSTTQQTRQTWGCPYEPPPDAGLRPYVRVPAPLGCDADPTACPGYTTKLPEVIEVARGRFHWTHGGPRGIGIDDWLEHPMIRGIEILEGEANAVLNWRVANPEKS